MTPRDDETVLLDAPVPGGAGVALDGGWRLALAGYDERLQRVHAALFSLAGAGIGVSGAPLLVRASAQRWLVVAGVYDGEGAESHLLVGPTLAGTAIAEADHRLVRELDLRSGVLRELVAADGNGPDTVMERFVSLARPGVVALRTRPAPRRSRPAASLVAGEAAEHGSQAGIAWARVRGSRGGIAAALGERRVEDAVEGVVAVLGDPEAVPARSDAVELARSAATAGFERLLADQITAWGQRWEESDVVVEDDTDLQCATRFALFHLMSGVPPAEEAAVGARGVTGTAYRGHVFWDADTFVLPFLAATHPPSASAMLRYRFRRLPAARDAARAEGRSGARFPWESAGSGRDVTPTSARDRAGHLMAIRTGDLEAHIVAEVAWATWEFLQWTGDELFAAGEGWTLLTETARYWASRVRVDAEGRGHIDGVIGPDEYHEDVDDNAFTNVMARWNLRTAAGLDGVGPAEAGLWREIADSLVDGRDPASGIYEQFRGFSELEPLVIAEVAPRRPIAADLLLGADRVARSQVVKQADVLMAHHLVPDEMAPGSLRANLEHYEPLTAHGSSLSPAVHAALFARLGMLERAVAALAMASRIDLDDLTGTTAGGLHLATMGGLWQALVYGFAGTRPRRGRLFVDPVVPAQWGSLTVNVSYRGARVRLVASADRLEVTAEHAVPMTIGTTEITVGPGPVAALRSEDGWEIT